MRLINIILVTICCFFIFIDSTYSQEYLEEEKGDIFSTRFCTIFYEEGVDLEKLDRSINLGFSDFYSPRRYRPSMELSVKEMLTDKFDAIFNRVEDILDMYPSDIHVSINIYKTKDALDKAYEEIFNEPNKTISFYVYNTNTIYTTESVVNEGILAHEMAHCIIDHYFIILPPKRVQEMLAVYSDVHLKGGTLK